MGHTTLTMPLLGVVCQPTLGLHIVYLCAKCYDSGFSRSSNIIGAPKFKEALLQRDHTTRYVRKFVLCFTRYGS